MITRRHILIASATLGTELASARPPALSAGNADPYMFAAHRQGSFGSPVASDAGRVYCCDAVTYYSPGYAVHSPRLAFAAVYADKNTTIEHALGNDLPFQGVSIEIAGVRTPLTVDGAPSWTVANGRYVWTDANSLVIPANTTFRIITATNVAAGLLRNSPMRVNPTMALDGVRQGATDQSAYLRGVGTFLATTGTTCMAPQMIVAQGWAAAGKPPVPLIIGDSIAAGNNDTQYGVPANGVWGYLARGLTDNGSSTRLPYCNLAIHGVSYSAVAAGTFAIRKQMMAEVGYPFTTIISAMGTNAGGAASAIAGWPPFGAFLKTMGNKPIIQTTMLAKSTAKVANLGWTTLDNQVRIDFAAYNQWIRAKSDVNLDHYIDMVGQFESAHDSGLWAVPSFSTLLAADFVSGAKVLSLTAAPPVHATLVLAAGTTNYKNFGVVESVTGAGPYTVQLRNYVTGTAYLAGTSCQEVNTTDGVHPLTRNSETGMAPIIAAKNSGVLRLTSLLTLKGNP